MSSALGFVGHLGDTVTVVASMATTLAVGAVGVSRLVTQNADSAGYEAAAVMASLISVSCFAGALGLIRSTKRLRPALWGYLPGLAAVLVTGLLMSERSTLAADGAVSPFLGALILLVPTTWVPIYAALRAHVEAGREDATARSWRGRR